MNSSGMFAGIKVIAVTRVVAAPFAAYQLALHGADVITIENPVDGDSYRYSGDGGTKLPEHGMGCGFLAHGANKRSVTVNISKPEGQDILRRLCKDADVFMENLRSGDMARYQLGYEHLSALNPRLIYCSVTGYGQTGPKRRDPAIDVAIQAASGMMSITGTPQSGPVKVGATVVDYGTGFAAALAIVSALYHRERTGRGQCIDVSMLETALMMMSSNLTRAATTGFVAGLAGNRTGHGSYISNSFRCKEGVVVIAAGAETRRRRLYKAIGREDILTDARFATPALCRRNLDALEAIVTEGLSSRTAQEWEDVLNEVGVPAMCVRSLGDIIQHPQIVSRNFFHRFDRSEDLGVSITVPRTSYHMSEGEARVDTPPARLGQHTDEVLRGLGYADAEIAKMRGAGIV